MKFDCELTDTFAGEANYSWVKRAQFEASDNAKQSLLVRRAKKALGIIGRHKASSFGDVIELRFGSECIVAFITPSLEG